MIDVYRHNSENDPPHWNLIDAATRARCDDIADRYGLGQCLVELVLAKPEDGHGVTYRVLICFPDVDNTHGLDMVDASKEVARVIARSGLGDVMLIAFNDLKEFHTELLAGELRYHEPEIKAHLAARAMGSQHVAALGALSPMIALQDGVDNALAMAGRIYWWSWLAAFAWMVFGDPPTWAIVAISAAALITILYRRHERKTGDG